MEWRVMSGVKVWVGGAAQGTALIFSQDGFWFASFLRERIWLPLVFEIGFCRIAIWRLKFRAKELQNQVLQARKK